MEQPHRMHVDAQATQYDRAPPSPTPQSPHEQLATRLGYDLSLFRDLDEDKRLHADEFLRRPLSAASMATSFNGTPALARSQRGRSGSDASDAAEAVARRTHANLRSLQLQEDAAKEQQQRRRRANPRIRRIPSVGSMGKRVATPSAPVGGAVGLVALAAEERRQQRASALNRSMLLGTAGSSGQSPSPRQLPPSHPTTPVSPVSMRSSSPPLHPAFSPYPFHPVAHAANTRATGGGAGADEGTTVPSLMAGQGRMDHHQVITGSVIVGGNSDKPERAMPRPQSAPWTPQPRQRHDAAEFFTAGSGHQMVYDASQRPRTAFSTSSVAHVGHAAHPNHDWRSSTAPPKRLLHPHGARPRRGSQNTLSAAPKPAHKRATLPAGTHRQRAALARRHRHAAKKYVADQERSHKYAKGRPIMHNLMEHFDQKEQSTRDGLLFEWMASYDREAETRLRQSLVFGNQVVQPNYLSTAVAFQVLGEVTHVFGRFKPLMELIVGILSKAVYKTDPLLPQAPFDPSDPAQLHKYEDDVLRAYFKATPFFVEYERKEAELERMGQMLQSITEQFEKSGAHNLGGRLKGLVSQWAQDARQAKLRGQLGELSAQLKDANEAYRSLHGDLANKTPTQRVVSLYSHLGIKQQERALHRILHQTTPLWSEILRFLLTRMGAGDAVRVIVKVIPARSDVEVMNKLLWLVKELVCSDKVTCTDDGRYRILAALLTAVDQFDVMVKTAGDHLLMGRLWAFLGESLHSVSELLNFHPELISRVFDSLTTEERQELTKLLFHSERRVRKKAGGKTKAEAAMSEQFAGLVSMMTIAERKAFIKECALQAGETAAMDILTSIHTEEAQAVPTMLSTRSYEETEAYYHTILKGVDPAILMKLIPEDLWPKKEVEVVQSKKKKHKKRSMKKSPLGRFMRPVAKADMARVNKAKVLFLLYECYEKKMVAESEWADDMDVQNPYAHDRHPIVDFLKSFLVQKVGLPSIRDKYLYRIVDTVRKFGHSSHRVRMFGTMAGILQPERYAPRISYVIMALYRMLFGKKFSSSLLKNRKEGQLFVEYGTAVEAISQVFPTLHMPFSRDRESLSPHRRSALLNAIENMAGSYEHMLTTRSEERGLKMKAFSRVSLGSSQSLSDRSVATPHSRDATGTSTSAGTGAGAGAGAGSGSGAGLSSPGSQSKSSDKGKGNEFTATDGLSGLMEGLSSKKKDKLLKSSDTVGKGLEGVQDVIHDQHDFEPNDSVVDVDQLLALCVQTWLDQEADDQQLLHQMYSNFDADGDGILQFGEFTRLVAELAPGVSSKDTGRLFDEVTLLDGEASGDRVSADAFCHLCITHGLSPRIYANVSTQPESYSGGALLYREPSATAASGAAGHAGDIDSVVDVILEEEGDEEV